MVSIAAYTYPQMVWRNHSRKLWNPVHRKPYENRPEERVRLRIIEALLNRGWSKHRISTEEGVGKLGDTALRTDIICYNQQFEPRLLVECKAEHIPLSVKTAEQVARYNHKVNSPFLLLSNGHTDYWYRIAKEESNTVEKMKNPPGLLDVPSAKPDYVLEEWQSRGFAGTKAAPDLRKWLMRFLPLLWLPDDLSSVRHLSFSMAPSDLDLNHYYRIMSVNSQRRLAFTTLTTPYGGSCLVCILNQGDENKAVLEVNLDLLFDNKKANSVLYSREGTQTIDADDFFDFRSIAKVGDLVGQADQLFVKFVG